MAYNEQDFVPIDGILTVTGDIVDNTDPQNPVINNPEGGVQSVTGDLVDNTDPQNPIINNPEGGVQSVTGDLVDNTDPQNPIINNPEGGVQSVTGNLVDNTDPLNPIINDPGGGGVESVTALTSSIINNTDPLNPILKIETGLFQPVPSAEVNLDDPASLTQGIYFRIGDVFHMSGLIAINPAAVDTLTTFEFTLPFAVNTGSGANVVGVAIGISLNDGRVTARIDQFTQNGKAVFHMISVDAFPVELSYNLIGYMGS